MEHKSIADVLDRAEAIQKAYASRSAPWRLELWRDGAAIYDANGQVIFVEGDEGIAKAVMATPQVLTDLVAEINALRAPLRPWQKIVRTNAAEHYLGLPDIEYHSPDGSHQVHVWESRGAGWTWRILLQPPRQNGVLVKQIDSPVGVSSLEMVKRFVCAKMLLEGFPIQIEALP